MERNSTLEHLWDMGMSKENKRDRALMYKPSVPKGEAGLAIPRAPIDHLNLMAGNVPTPSDPIKTYIPTPDASKIKSTHTDVNTTIITPQTRKSIYPYLQQAGAFANEPDMDINKWLGLNPKDTYRYLGNTDKVGVTTNPSGNPGGISYASKESIKSKARIGKQPTLVDPSKYLTQTKGKGGLLVTKPLTRKELDASKRIDDRKDSSLRKPNEVPGSANKSRSHRQ